MTKRREQLVKEKIELGKSMSYFESQAVVFCDHKHSSTNNTTITATTATTATNYEQKCPICYNYVANVITQCGHLFCRSCIIKCLKKKHQCPVCKIQVNPTDAHEIKIDDSRFEPIINDEKILRYGSKLTKLLEIIKKITELGEKVVLYIQWSPLMNSIYTLLKENNIEACMVFGNTACQNMAIKKFKTTSMNVLLGSIDNTGLDLVNANHLIFVHALTGEDYMVKAAEDQAIARIQRTGQTKKVHVYWLITRGTIEEQIYLQTRVSK
jgi:SNF2 family DNA or RNA helicase